MARDSPFLGNTLTYAAILILAVPTLTEAQSNSGPALNPYLDPKDDFNNPLKYIASNNLTAIGFVLILLVAFAQTFHIVRYGARWMLVMVIGVYTYAIGFGIRFALHYHPDALGTYICDYLFIVLSPCAFIAANYILLGRLARHISCTSHTTLPVDKLTISFLTSDITTFCIQAIGGGMSISHNPARVITSQHMFLTGLVLQLASFAVFSVIYARFLYRVYTRELHVWVRDKARPWYRDWRALAGALVISCIGILVRCGYRVAEISQGYHSYLATTEIFFYMLDSLPLLVAIFIYVLFWPGWFITEGALALDAESKTFVSV